jgi:anti-anti-sigma factor
MNRSSVAVIELAGEINGHVMLELSALIGALVDQHRRHVVVNLSGAAQVHRRGIQSLVKQTKQLRSMGGDVKIVGMRPALERTFCAVDAARFFERYDTLEAAVDGFTRHDTQPFAPRP